MADTAPAIPDTSNRLPVIAAQIVQEHEAAHRAARTAIDHAIRCGELLIEAKAELPHGKWEKWLKKNSAVTPRTARAYMQIAALDPGKRQRVAELPMREALKAVAQHKYLPDDERVLVIREENRQKYNAWCREHGHPERPAVAPAPQIFRGQPHLSITASPPPPPPTPSEIADELIRQLAQSLYEVSDQITVDDLRAAFDRRFGMGAVDDGTRGAAA